MLGIISSLAFLLIGAYWGESITAFILNRKIEITIFDKESNIVPWAIVWLESLEKVANKKGIVRFYRLRNRTYKVKAKKDMHSHWSEEKNVMWHPKKRNKYTYYIYK